MEQIADPSSAVVEGAGAPETKVPESEVPKGISIPDKQGKEIARLTRVIQSRQEEIARLKGEQQTPSIQTPVDDSIKGDEDGMHVLHGIRVPVDFAKQFTQMSKTLEGLQSELADSKSASENSRIADEQKQVRIDLANEVRGAISEVRAQMFKDVPEEHVGSVDRDIFERADRLLSEALEKGATLNQDAINASITGAFEEAGKLFGIFGAKQVTDNEEYERTYKNTKDIPASVTKEEFKKMSPQDRDKFVREAARLAGEDARSGK